ncbi:hypothetical protein [Streptomyces chartreusis]|uniref:hypothetical protein n=1 Tax=Streptomyces chartreusis TaxID=1969 RepID=UPI00363FBBE4
MNSPFFVHPAGGRQEPDRIKPVGAFSMSENARRPGRTRTWAERPSARPTGLVRAAAAGTNGPGGRAGRRADGLPTALSSVGSRDEHRE